MNALLASRVMAPRLVNVIERLLSQPGPGAAQRGEQAGVEGLDLITRRMAPSLGGYGTDKVPVTPWVDVRLWA